VNRAEYTDCGWDVLERQGTLIEWALGEVVLAGKLFARKISLIEEKRLV
jgi:hypothetical protein